MSIVVRYAPQSVTKAKYDETMRTIEAAVGEEGPPGCAYHICFGSEGNLMVSEVWDSREQWEAFGKQLMPILTQAGIDPGEPQVFEVHNILQRP
jgi:hypothetical protein